MNSLFLFLREFQQELILLSHRSSCIYFCCSLFLLYCLLGCGFPPNVVRLLSLLGFRKILLAKIFYFDQSIGKKNVNLSFKCVRIMFTMPPLYIDVSTFNIELETSPFSLLLVSSLIILASKTTVKFSSVFDWIVLIRLFSIFML